MVPVRVNKRNKNVSQHIFLYCSLYYLMTVAYSVVVYELVLKKIY